MAKQPTVDGPKKYPANERGTRAAAEAVRDRRLVIFPTETCYGIGGDALDKSVVRQVYKAKRRPREKQLSVVVASDQMAERYAVLNATEKALMDAFMPGPLTLVAKKREETDDGQKLQNVPDTLNTKFVFRIPGNATARKLSQAANTPIIATSANISGEPENYTVDTISDTLLGGVEVVLDAGELERTKPSTIVEVTETGVNVYREGPVSRQEIEQVLRER